MPREANTERLPHLVSVMMSDAHVQALDRIAISASQPGRRLVTRSEILRQLVTEALSARQQMEAA